MNIDSLPVWVRQWINLLGYVPEKWSYNSGSNLFNFVSKYGDWNVMFKDETPWYFNSKK
jgi:hypothetical protein